MTSADVWKAQKTASKEPRRRPHIPQALKSAALVLFLALLAFLMSLPFLWMILSSFKPNSELFAYPPVWIPTTWTLEHYVSAFRTAPFGRYFFNSAVTGVGSTAINIFFTSLAGFAFAKYDFRYKNVAFFTLIATMMVPFHVILIPLFIIAKNFPLVGGNSIFGTDGTGLLNTYPGLVLPHLVPAFGVFLTRQFFLGLPDDLIDAARIDGASEFRIYWSIALPTAKPALATLAIFSFTTIWDDFLWPLVVTTSNDMRTVQLGLQVFQSQFSVDWGPLMAATVAVTAPLILLFIAFQKHFVRGVISSGVKG